MEIAGVSLSMSAIFSLWLCVREFFFHPRNLEIALADQPFEVGDAELFFGGAMRPKEGVRPRLERCLPCGDLGWVSLVFRGKFCKGFVTLGCRQGDLRLLVCVEYVSHREWLLY